MSRCILLSPISSMRESLIATVGVLRSINTRTGMDAEGVGEDEVARKNASETRGVRPITDRPSMPHWNPIISDSFARMINMQTS